MGLTKNKLFFGILIFGLTTILLVLFNIQYFYLRVVFSFIFLTTIPGLLVMLMFKIKKIGFWEYLVYTIGLSITFLMFAGLAVNWILPWLHITIKPLGLMPLLISFGIILTIFAIIAYKQNTKISLKIKLPNLGWLNKIFFITAVIFPVLSIFGAITLNNGGLNFFTMTMLGGIAVYVLLVVPLRGKLNEHIFPWSILFISVSLLLMYSLRSWHITGWDINQEFQVFQNTKTINYWNLSSLQNAYNTCLSLTILPTVISRFTNISDEYIFKIVYQLIFCLVPLVMYCLYRKYVSTIISFLAVFFFISLPNFIQPMTALARQETAFFFFALTLLVLLTNHLNRKTKDTIFVIFGFSMVVSHYSTTYVAITLFVLCYILLMFYSKTQHFKFFRKSYAIFNLRNKKSENIKYDIKFIPILLIIVFTILWGTQLTKSANGLFNIIINTTSNMGQIFSSNWKSNDLRNSLSVFSTSNVNTSENIEEYNKEETEINKNIINSTNRYDNFGDEKISPIYDVMLEPKIIAPYVNQFIMFLNIIRLLIKVFLVAGTLYIFFSKFKNSKMDRSYLVLCLVGSGVVLMMYVLPVISIEYNSTRLYLQILIMLSLPTICGGFLFLKFFNEKLRIYLVGIIFVLYFLYASGFISQFFGGNASMQLNNFGQDFDKYYTNQEEVNSAIWLSEKRYSKSPIFADELSALRLYSFGNLNDIEKVILPSTITKNSYVYLRYANVIRDRTDAHYKNTTLIYTYPNEFLENNKNLIYNNSGSKIYK